MTVPAGRPGPSAGLPSDPITGAPTGRELYIDLLRVAAIARVLLYHSTERGWLTVLFPAMGVMFALGGSLAARSLDAAERAGRRPASVIAGRFRRLLPSLWVFAIVALSLSPWLGWGTDHNRAERLDLIWWLLPLHAPTRVGGDDAWVFTGIVWYLTAYLWFVLLSPVLLRLLRSWPLPTLGGAVALPVVLWLHVVDVGGWIQPQAYDLAQYGACWLLGMAHRDGRLARIRPAVLWPVVAALAAITLASLVASGQTVDTVDMDRLPVLNALWSAAFATALLRLTPSLAWSGKLGWLTPAVRAVNARVLTIYLWHYPSLLLARWLTGWQPGVGPWLWPSGVLMVLFTAGAALAFGWVEDLAAGRTWRVLPWRIPRRGSATWA